jgi:hypothetical protein
MDVTKQRYSHLQVLYNEEISLLLNFLISKQMISLDNTINNYFSSNSRDTHCWITKNTIMKNAAVKMLSILAISILRIACEKDDVDPAKAKVMVIHASPNAPNVEVCLMTILSI